MKGENEHKLKTALVLFVCISLLVTNFSENKFDYTYIRMNLFVVWYVGSSAMLCTFAHTCASTYRFVLTHAMYAYIHVQYF